MTLRCHCGMERCQKSSSSTSLRELQAKCTAGWPPDISELIQERMRSRASRRSRCCARGWLDEGQPTKVVEPVEWNLPNRRLKKLKRDGVLVHLYAGEKGFNLLRSFPKKRGETWRLMENDVKARHVETSKSV